MNWRKEVKVLIIEDNKDLLELEEMHMRIAGFENIFLAENSEEAETLLNEHKIDLCLSDIKFPTKDGVEVMRNAKVKNQTPGILIFISGFNDYKLDQLKAVGACEYFEKPVKFEKLIQFIESKYQELHSNKEKAS